MDREKTCCITGPFPENLPFGYDENAEKCTALKQILKDEIKRQIKEGISNFVTGVNIGVELLGAETVLEAKQEFPEITLTSVIPFEAQASEWPEPLRDRYFSVLEQSDVVNTVQPRFNDMCAHNTREYLTDSSSVLIAVWNGTEGNETDAIMKSANREGNTVIIIYPQSL